MILKKSSGVFVSNFDIVFKLLAYLAVLGTFILAGAILLYIPIIKGVVDEIISTGIVGNVRNALSQFLTFSPMYEETLVSINSNITVIEGIVSLNSSKLIAGYFAFAFLISVGQFFLSIAYFSVSDISATFMKTSMSDLFLTNLFRNIKVSVIYALFNVLFMLPLNTLIIFGCIKIFSSLIGTTALTPMLIIVVAVTFWALKSIFFALWLPVAINEKKKVFPSLLVSFKLAIKHFFNLFCRYWVLGLVCWMIIAIGIATTYGVALIIIFPAMFTFLKVYEQVTYFDMFKQKYYLSETEVYAPKE